MFMMSSLIFWVKSILTSPTISNGFWWSHIVSIMWSNDVWMYNISQLNDCVSKKEVNLLPAAQCLSGRPCVWRDKHRRRMVAPMSVALQTAIIIVARNIDKDEFWHDMTGMMMTHPPECNPRAGLDLPAEARGRWRCLWDTFSPGCTAASRASDHSNYHADADADVEADAYHGSIIVNISPLRRDCHPLLVLCSHRTVILKDFVCRAEKLFSMNRAAIKRILVSNRNVELSALFMMLSNLNLQTNNDDDEINQKKLWNL